VAYRTAFTIYGVQFFKNLEEVKKTRDSCTERLTQFIGSITSAEKRVGFDCIKPIYG
jgi:hypothetical protein